MIVLDLKVVLLVLLGLVTAVTLLATAVWTLRRPFPLSRFFGDDLSRTLDTAPFGLVLLDQTPVVLYANSYVEGLLPAAWQADLLADVGQLQAAAEMTTQYRVLNLPSEQAVSWWICPVSEGYLALLWDLSRQRQLERATQRFLSNLSHELRTPLTAVLAHIEVMRMPDLPDEMHQNSLDLIQKETNRIARLVQNLLHLSRVEATPELNKRPLNLLLIVEEAVADIFLEAETKGIVISLEADTGLAQVMADPDMMKQVLLNLLDNAVKYGREGDTILVSLRQQTGQEPPAVLVTVQDTGPGIPSAHLPHVTQELYRGRTDVAGSGLGLAIVTEILRRHDSRLIIESECEGAQAGTAVRFALPIA